MLVFCRGKLEIYLISYPMRWDYCWWYSFYWKKVRDFRAKILKQIIPITIITCECVLCKFHRYGKDLIIHQWKWRMQCSKRSCQWLLNISKVNKICSLEHSYSWSLFLEKIFKLLFWCTFFMFVGAFLLLLDTWLELYVKTCVIWMNQRTPL